jgi:putative transposase
MTIIKRFVTYKAEEADTCRLVEVPTRYVEPSQTCPAYGLQEKKLLEQRMHICSRCGYTAPRDVAPAQVMLAWALNQLGTDWLASSCNLGTMIQETDPSHKA